RPDRSLMTTTTAHAEALTGAGLRRVLVVLCVTEITSWGVLYYAFPVLAPSISASTGWSLMEITAAFSVSQVVSALGGIVVGRLLVPRGPRRVMPAGSVAAVPAVLRVASRAHLGRFGARS